MSVPERESNHEPHQQPHQEPHGAGGPRPVSLDVDRARGMTVRWDDDSSAFLEVRTLRRQSPSADARELRSSMAKNPLTVLPASSGAAAGPLTITAVEPIGHYAVRIRFSDGHDTGIYSWKYLHELCRTHGKPVQAR
ncbi:MAG: DUF971 domain-containing protein [Planctomycetaceae bacterium]|nr:DUF971 domain-containing protein [Planctomycetaceae bacterium]